MTVWLLCTGERFEGTGDVIGVYATLSAAARELTRRRPEWPQRFDAEGIWWETTATFWSVQEHQIEE